MSHRVQTDQIDAGQVRVACTCSVLKKRGLADFQLSFWTMSSVLSRTGACREMPAHDHVVCYSVYREDRSKTLRDLVSRSEATCGPSSV